MAKVHTNDSWSELEPLSPAEPAGSSALSARGAGSGSTAGSVGSSDDRRDHRVTFGTPSSFSHLHVETKSEDVLVDNAPKASFSRSRMPSDVETGSYERGVLRKGPSSFSSARHTTFALPEGKTHHCFLSHKKAHSKHGSEPGQIAKNVHDSLELLGFASWCVRCAASQSALLVFSVTSSHRVLPSSCLTITQVRP